MKRDRRVPISWVAVYGDIEVRQDDGALYGEIDRGRLTSFRLVSGPDILVEVITTDAGMFFYRRRVSMGPEGEQVYILVGNVANDIIAYDTLTGTVIMGRIGDSHPLVDFSPPVAHPNEGEKF